MQNKLRYTQEEIEQWFKEILCTRGHNPKPKEVVIITNKYKYGFIVKPYEDE